MNICPNIQGLRMQKQDPMFRVLELLSRFFTDLDMSFHPSEVCGLSGSCTRRSPPYSCRSDRSHRCSPGIRQCLGEKKKTSRKSEKRQHNQKVWQSCWKNQMSFKRPGFQTLFLLLVQRGTWFLSCFHPYRPSTIPPPSLHRSPWIPPWKSARPSFRFSWNKRFLITSVG